VVFNQTNSVSLFAFVFFNLFFQCNLIFRLHSYCPRFKLQAAVEPVDARDHNARLEDSALHIAALMPHCPAVQPATAAAVPSDSSVRSSSETLADLDAFSRYSLPYFPFRAVEHVRLRGFEFHSRAFDDPQPADWRHALHVPQNHATQSVHVNQLSNFATDFQNQGSATTTLAHSHAHQAPADYAHTVRYSGFPIARIPFEVSTQPHYQSFIETSAVSDFLFGHVQVALERIPDATNPDCVSVVRFVSFSMLQCRFFPKIFDSFSRSFVIEKIIRERIGSKSSALIFLSSHFYPHP
jgi:hypothetical protein